MLQQCKETEVTQTYFVFTLLDNNNPNAKQTHGSLNPRIPSLIPWTRLHHCQPIKKGRIQIVDPASGSTMPHYSILGLISSG